NPEQVELVANEACRRALNQRGVSHICFPVDYQTKPVKGKTTMHNQKGATGGAWAPVNPVPEKTQLEAAAKVLNEGKKIAILVGQGARNAGPDVIELAEKLGAPVIKALLGKDVIPDDHPLTTGGLGLLGTTPSQEAMEKCDTFIMIGTSFPYMEFLPKPGKARCVQIDDKPNRIGLRYPVEVGLVGDSKRTLAELLPLIEQKQDLSFLKAAQEGMKKWDTQMRKASSRKDTPLKPQAVAEVLSELASDDAIISGDSGTNTTWIARHFKIRANQKFSCSGNLATMAPGLPYAIAAKIAFPERQSIAFVGDGGFTMLMGEFATACKYNLPIVIVIIKNNTLGQIKWEQIVFLGNPEYGCELHSIDFAKYAESCGGSGFKITHPDELEPVLKQAIGSGRPCVVEVVVDPLEPPMPSKVEASQAAKFAKALLRGEPQGKEIVQTVVKDKLNELR
ncbi:MAG TPA: thiamine pyrophosphate-dependent enzyme, partial [Chroococcales cyanobacterium]